MWKGMVVCPGVPLFEAEARLLTTDRSLSAAQLSTLLPYNLHVTGRLDKQAGQDYLQQLLSDPSRMLCFLLLTPIVKNNNSNDTGDDDGEENGVMGLRMIEEMLVNGRKYGVGVGNAQNVKDIYFLTVPDAEALSMLSIAPSVSSVALVVVIVPQRHTFK